MTDDRSVCQEQEIEAVGADPIEVQEALLREILDRGGCLSRISLKVGYGTAELRKALHVLLEQKLIREKPHQEHRDEVFRSYEANI